MLVMARYEKGDVVRVWHVWREPDGTVDMKPRPGIVYDVIAEDHYCILVYGKDRTGRVPGFTVDYKSKDGKGMGLTKDSFVNLSKFVPLRKADIIKQIGNCSESLMEKIEKAIDDFGIERPLN